MKGRKLYSLKKDLLSFITRASSYWMWSENLQGWI